MKAQEFVKGMESVFGEYRAGMRTLVEDWACRQTPALLSDVASELFGTHDAYWPPTLAMIRRVSAEIAARPPRLIGLPESARTEEEYRMGTTLLAKLKELVAKKTFSVEQGKSGQKEGAGEKFEEGKDEDDS